MLRAIAAVFVLFLIAVPLLLRFRPKWVAGFNLVVTNRITGPFATWLPGFGVVTHIGRKSGRRFRTPVNVFHTPEGFVIALTYGPESQWVQNVLAAGGAELETRHHRTTLQLLHSYTIPHVASSPFQCELPCEF
jgi:hypothetical protein